MTMHPEREAAALSVDEVIAQACPSIHAAGSGYYSAPSTLARGRELGLDGTVRTFYMIGRGGVLGDVDAALVESSFGYFEPSYIEKAWNSVREIVSPAEGARAYAQCCADVGRLALENASWVEEYCAAASTVIASADPVGLPMYAAYRVLPVAEDPAAQAMQLTVVLRELRGAVHLLAVRACGLSGRNAHLAERPHMAASFGWSPDEVDSITSADRDALRRSETMTDDLLKPAFGALDQAGARALVDGSRLIFDALLAAGWGGPTRGWAQPSAATPQ